MSATTAPTRTLYLPSGLTIGLGTLALILLFWRECQAAVSVWVASTAYGHCFLVLPMALYLGYERRGALAGVSARPEPLFALLALPVAAAWFAAERLGIMEGRQLAAIGAVEVLCLTVLGWTLFRALLAPLAFLVFLVPFGAFITPALQVVTAHITEAGLNLLRIPNYVTEFTIEIPEGTFYVAEACAGLRFLIAAVAFGVFYALLNYRSPGRRIAFIAASIVVPIFANGLRALGIVVLGHVLGSAEAAVADHIIYGWVFFSFVMVLLVLAGMPLRENAALARPAEFSPTPPAPVWRAAAACIVVVLLTALGPAVARGLDSRQTVPRLAVWPELVIPSRCTAETMQRSETLQAQMLACQGVELTVTTEVFSARSKPDALTRARRERSGELIAEDTDIHPLPGTLPQAGPWLLISTIDPFQMTAASIWVDGAPPAGGLRGRFGQARDSVAGASHVPMIFTAATRSTVRPSPAEQARIIETLTALANAQGDLGRIIERATRAE